MNAMAMTASNCLKTAPKPSDCLNTAYRLLKQAVHFDLGTAHVELHGILLWHLASWSYSLSTVCHTFMFNLMKVVLLGIIN